MKKEMLYNGWLKIERIHHPDGRPYEKLHMHSAVAGLIRDSHNRILIVRQYRPAIGANTWELPAGILDIKGEHPLDTLKRELVEEANLNPKEFRMSHNIGTYRMSQGCADAVMYIYSMEYGIKGEDLSVILDKDVDECKWVSEQRFIELMEYDVPGSKELFVKNYLEVENLKNNIRTIIGA